MPDDDSGGEPDGDGGKSERGSPMGMGEGS